MIFKQLDRYSYMLFVGLFGNWGEWWGLFNSSKRP
jgi:hypothetical protein